MTKKQLKEFKKYFEDYLKKLDLGYFDVFYYESNLNSVCQLNINTESKIIDVYYDPNITQKRKHMLNTVSTKYLAKHEAIHVLLADFKNMAKSRFINEDQIDSEEEKLVQILAKNLK